MTSGKAPASAPAHELERIITRMQEIQRAIQASHQPASMLELEELKALGREYARIIDRLANDPRGSGFA
ncbi:MAG: hypothetical protein PVI50_04010 [Gammaproteobacteria bacterium]